MDPGNRAEHQRKGELEQAPCAAGIFPRARSIRARRAHLEGVARAGCRPCWCPARRTGSSSGGRNARTSSAPVRRAEAAASASATALGPGRRGSLRRCAGVPGALGTGGGPSRSRRRRGRSRLDLPRPPRRRPAAGRDRRGNAVAHQLAPFLAAPSHRQYEPGDQEAGQEPAQSAASRIFRPGERPAQPAGSSISAAIASFRAAAASL